MDGGRALPAVQRLSSRLHSYSVEWGFKYVERQNTGRLGGRKLYYSALFHLAPDTKQKTKNSPFNMKTPLYAYSDGSQICRVVYCAFFSPTQSRRSDLWASRPSVAALVEVAPLVGAARVEGGHHKLAVEGATGEHSLGFFGLGGVCVLHKHLTG